MEIEEKRKKLKSYMDLADNLKSLQKAYEFKRTLAMKITAATPTALITGETTKGL